MPFNIWRSFSFIIGWLIFISFLHQYLNFERGDRKTIYIGYMPVVTNLAAPLLDYATLKGNGIRFKSLKFSSFAEMAEALRHNEIQAALMIAPLSIVLKQQGEDIKVVYIGNRHESSLVTRKELNIKTLKDLTGKTIAVPMRYSGHNLSILHLLEEQGLLGDIKIVEMNPPDMASALISGSLDAYYVGEPFAAQTLRSGDANLLHHVEDVWPGFICNLMVVKQDFIDQDSDAVKKLVSSAIRSGLWADQNMDDTISLASRYWNQSKDLVNYALTQPKKRIVFDQYIPKQSEMLYMAELMLKYDLIENTKIDKLVDDHFARTANLEQITDIYSILNNN
ncbi:MAG: ABC transporter substrate-binding protein [Pseudomonadota bacterium]